MCWVRAIFLSTRSTRASLRLEGGPAIRLSIEDLATPFELSVGFDDALTYKNLAPGGFDDLILKFNTQEIIQALGEVQHGEVRVLKVTGNLLESAGGRVASKGYVLSLVGMGANSPTTDDIFFLSS